MYLIVGLGNPGKKYAGTKHNMGFDVIDCLVDEYRIPSSGTALKGLYGKGLIGGEKVLLVKPLTFMNASGECVRAFADYYKVDPKTELVVVYDDISLEPGAIRVRGALSSIWERRISSGSGSVSAGSRRDGIWRIMCWRRFRNRTGRWWTKGSGGRRRLSG